MFTKSAISGSVKEQDGMDQGGMWNVDRVEMKTGTCRVTEIYIPFVPPAVRTQGLLPPDSGHCATSITHCGGPAWRLRCRSSKVEPLRDPSSAQGSIWRCLSK